MAGCGKKVSQFVERGWTFKEVFTPCGSTDQYGGQLLCDECEARMERAYPQGWRDYPGDTCKHGTYIGGPGDCLCGACEAE